MKMSNALWLAPLLGVLATPVLADNERNGHRQDRQQARIEQGIRKGDLTRHETRKPHHEQHRIAKTERHDRRDGQVDRHERRDLNLQRVHASGHIRQLKHKDRDYGHYHKHDRRYRDHGHHYGWHHKKHQHRHDRHRHDHGYAGRGRYYDDNGNWWVMFGLWDSL